MLKRIIEKTWHHWEAFWFTQKDYDLVATFRVCFAAIMFTYYFSRIPDIELFFTNTGFLPTSYMPSHAFFKQHFTALAWIDNVTWLQLIHGVFLLSLLTMALGIYVRYSAIIAWLLHLMFVARNPAVQYGADLVASFYFLYFCFVTADSRFTLLKRKNGKEPSEATQIIHSVALNLMRIQLCVIYFYSGISKLKGVRWWNGSAIWDVFTMEGLVRWDLSFIAYFPHILVAACYLTILWEVYFPALIWTKVARLPLIIVGVLMHIGFGIFINIPNFGVLIVSLYILFLREEELNWLLQKMRSICIVFLPLESRLLKRTQWE